MREEERERQRERETTREEKKICGEGGREEVGLYEKRTEGRKPKSKTETKTKTRKRKGAYVMI